MTFQTAALFRNDAYLKEAEATVLARMRITQMVAITMVLMVEITRIQRAMLRPLLLSSHLSA